MSEAASREFHLKKWGWQYKFTTQPTIESLVRSPGLGCLAPVLTHCVLLGTLSVLSRIWFPSLQKGCQILQN